ncbi:MAG: methyltransferase [Roseovarius sp.]
MAESDPGRGRGLAPSLWLGRLIASPRFQSLANRLPFSRAVARRDGAEIFDILQGFVASQALATLVETGLLRRLLDGAESPARLGLAHGVPPDRMAALLQAGAALGLLRRRRDGRYALARKGAAILGVPGLEDMIRHNSAFYADMADPMALLRGEGETELARFWPYVFGADGGMEPDQAARYSSLMARSQVLVAEDTLAAVSLKGVRRLLDVGGGSGVFLSAALRRYPALEGHLMDLPEVMPVARDALSEAGLEARVALTGASFREAPLPEGADAISLIRVLYDHEDDTVRPLLAKAYATLPEGGRLVISEPMSGGARPERAGDVYFAFYTMAMGTGRARSAARIAELCREAGFTQIRSPRPRRPFITSTLTCVKG